MVSWRWTLVKIVILSRQCWLVSQSKQKASSHHGSDALQLQLTDWWRNLHSAFRVFYRRFQFGQWRYATASLKITSWFTYEPARKASVNTTLSSLMFYIKRRPSIYCYIAAESTLWLINYAILLYCLTPPDLGFEPSFIQKIFSSFKLADLGCSHQFIHQVQNTEIEMIIQNIDYCVIFIL